MNMDLDDEELKATRKLLGLDKTKIEKSIENLKEYLEEDSLYVLHKKGENKESSDFDKFCIGHCEDIEVLITEYERQKQRNEELKSKLLDTIKGTNIIKKETPEYIKENYIPKQKIKDKIEELKDTLKHYDEYSKLNLLERVNIDLIDSKIEILEELLKESEDK